MALMAHCLVRWMTHRIWQVKVVKATVYIQHEAQGNVAITSESCSNILISASYFSQTCCNTLRQVFVLPSEITCCLVSVPF